MATFNTLNAAFFDINNLNQHSVLTINVGTNNATEFSYVADAGNTVRILGTGFTFDGSGNPTGGTVNTVQLVDSSSNPIIAIDALSDALTEVFANAGTADFYPDLLDENDTITSAAAGETLSGFDGEDTLTGASGVDVLSGGNDNDIINGAGGDDVLNGDAGNDQIRGGTGNDTIDGGEGTGDVAVYDGVLADFTITVTSSGFTVTDNEPGVNGNEGVDTLTGIEEIQFSDQTISLNEVLLLDGSNNVVGSFTTIQDAVDAAMTGFTVLVNDGTYNENVTISEEISLLSVNGRNSTTITGISGMGDLGAIVVTNSTDNVRIGDTDQGFTIVGIDNGNGAVENAAVYLQGSQDSFTLAGNDVVANGEHGLLSEIAGALTNAVIDGNIFSGQTFQGAQPGGIGFSTQFDPVNNVPRQLVVIGEGGDGPYNSTNIQFTNNEITGVTGGISSDDNVSEQGNTMVTIDVDGADISGNTFTGITARFGTALRARGPDSDIQNNTFDNSTGGDTRGISFGANSTGTDLGNVFTGGSDDDLFLGSRGGDTMTGDQGDDIFFGTLGDDMIDGGSDTDTAAYAGSASDYTIGSTMNASGLITAFTTVTDDNSGNGDEGTDTLTSIEVLSFNNGADVFSLADPVQLFDDGGNLVGTFDNLEAAVDAAADDYSIVLASGTINAEDPGTADGQILVDVDITITGQGMSSSTIIANADTGSSGDARGMFLINEGVIFDLNDLGIDGNGFSVFQALRHRGSGDIDNVAFNDIQFNPMGPNYAGTALAIFGTASNVNVTNSEFTDIGRIGALYFGSGVSGLFENNTYTGQGAGDQLDYALDISAGATVTVRGNTIQNNLGVASSDGSVSAAILVTTFFGPGTNAIIEDNNFDNNSNGVFVGFNSDDTSVVDFEGTNTFTNTGMGGAGVNVVGNGVVTDVDTITGDGSNVIWNGGVDDNTLTGAGLDDDLDGGDGADSITGNAGNDTLDGGDGADTLAGGTGDDTYFADSLDTITENMGEGTDTVITGESHVLAANVENLTLTDITSDTQDFEDFDLGPIMDGENDWTLNGNASRDQEVTTAGGSQVFRMSSDPTSGDFAGPYSPDLGVTAGESTTTADGDTHVLTFRFMAVSATPDNSRLEVDFGIEPATDRNNFMVIESIVGEGIRIATSEPLLDGNFVTGDDPGDLNDFAAFTGNRTIVSGLDASVWHEIELHLTYEDGADNDVIQIFVDGNFVGQTTTFENFFDFRDGGTHEDNVEDHQTNRIFFRPSAGGGAPQDGPEGQNQGFFFDDITNTIATRVDGTGNELDNVITGNSANNTLSGLGGNDTIDGGAGDDIIIGGTGTDTLSGGTGNDTFIRDISETTGTIDGGAGQDTLALQGTGSDDTVSVTLIAGILGGLGVTLTSVEDITLDLDGEIMAGDTLDYSGSTDDVTVDLAAGTASGFTSIADVENVTGGDGDDNLTGDMAGNVLSGNAGEDIINGGGGNDTLLGGSGADEIDGGEGNDRLDGGSGADVMLGGLGDDTYVVDNAGDTVFELASQGTDTVESSITYTLFANFENLTLTGTADIDGTGNSANNIIIGNSGSNTLSGLEGNDLLDGGAGADTLNGGIGNDIYIVDNAGDVVNETGLNFDIVRASVTANLSTANYNGAIEAVTLQGSDNINAIGNLLNNILTGNSGMNVINGLAGADNMRGRGGSDTYVIDNVGDVVDETLPGSSGFDRVLSSVTVNFSNTAQIMGALERIELTGSANINGTGNLLANSIVGNSGNNVLNGLNGNDVLTGGAGNDAFFFSFALGAGNVDTITDFDVASDRIWLDDAIFASLAPTGPIDSSEFRIIGTGPQDANDFLLYDQASGSLFYDADANGAGAAQIFAVVTPGTTLDSGDFLVV